MKVLKFLLPLVLLPLAVQSQMYGPGYGYGIDPDHDPRSKRHYFQDVEKCEIELKDGEKILLNQRLPLNESLQVMSRILADTETAAQLAKNFEEDRAAHKYEMKDLNYNFRQMNGLLEPDGSGNENGTMALFRLMLYVDNESGKKGQEKSREIYVDTSKDVGLVAIFMAHEIFHSRDEEGIRSLKEQILAEQAMYEKINVLIEEVAQEKGKKPEEVSEKDISWLQKKEIERLEEEYKKFADPIIFKHERFAFDFQDKLIQELRARGDCYREFLDNHMKSNQFKVLKDKTPDEFIIKSYGLKMLQAL